MILFIKSQFGFREYLKLPAPILAELCGILPLALIDAPGHDFLNVALGYARAFFRWSGVFGWFDFYEILGNLAVAIPDLDIEVHEISV